MYTRIMSKIVSGILALFIPVCCFAANSPAPDLKKLKVGVDTAGVFHKMRTEILKKDPHDTSDQTDILNGEPERVRIIFDNAKVDYDNTYGASHMLVYPLKQYAALYKGNSRAVFDKDIKTLKKVIAAKAKQVKGEIPVYPTSDCGQVFTSQESYPKFKGGSGVAFITNVSNGGDGPYQYKDLFYTFQGLTDDGKYYISFFCPIEPVGMPPNSEPKAARAYIRKLPRTKFKPNLNAVDHMLSSITLK